MCEATAYLLRADKEEVCLREIDLLESKGNELHITNIYGEQRIIRGKIRSISLVDHKIILEEM
jgi:predicted RNA-binding protein